MIDVPAAVARLREEADTQTRNAQLAEGIVRAVRLGRARLLRQLAAEFEDELGDN